jgi:hypothetical protein
VIWLIYAGVTALGMYVIGGVDDWRRRRAEARAVLRRAAISRHPAAPATYAEAHPRAHASHHAYIPRQRQKGGRR